MATYDRLTPETEWLRALVESAEPIERIHGEWIDEPMTSGDLTPGNWIVSDGEPVLPATIDGAGHE